MDRKQNYEKLMAEVERREAVVETERAIFEKANPEIREIHKLRRAEDLLRAAQIDLRNAERIWQRELAAIAREEERLVLSAPPSLQQLVLDHAIYDAAGKMIGGYERITPEAWAAFDARMAAWKAKVRYGEFPAKIWPPPEPKESAGGGG